MIWARSRLEGRRRKRSRRVSPGQPTIENLCSRGTWSGEPFQQCRVEEIAFFVEGIVTAPLEGDVGAVVEGWQSAGHRVGGQLKSQTPCVRKVGGFTPAIAAESG